VKGQGGLVGALIGLLIVIIIGLAVVFDVGKNIVLDINATGTERTIADQIPILLITVPVVAIAGLMLGILGRR